MRGHFKLIAGLAAAFLLPMNAYANEGGNQPPLECDGNYGECGTPEVSGGGGGGGGGGAVLIANTDLGDTYQHGDDFDDDGVEDDYDNCPRVPNREQFDGDGDGRGDLCDNCREVSNADQFDLDGDRKGDVCDADKDQDGVLNEVDNCPETFNPMTDDLQADMDGDNIGDACDDDLDGDGKLNADDPCPAKANVKGLEEVVFSDEECFPDTDKDGVHDFKDNCPRVANENQENIDGDKWGDVCDPDVDNDEVMNKLDNCVDVANQDQQDLDRDGIGEACDKSFCYVVHGDVSNCLDPKSVFKVYSPSLSTVIGDASPVNLRLFANRRDHAMSYTWTIEKSPAGSTASISAPTGSVESSSPFEYRYNQFPTIRPDVAGEYVIRVTAESRFNDPVSGEVGKVAVYEMRLKASGESEAAGGGCSATAQDKDFNGFALFLLVGIGAVGLRRRR